MAPDDTPYQQNSSPLRSTPTPSAVPMPLQHLMKNGELKDSGNTRQFETGAQRDCNKTKGRCDLLPARALLRLSYLYKTGCEKYGHRNWEMGMPASVLTDSALRHLFKYLAGERDEDHLTAVAWNILNLLEIEERVGEGLLPGDLLDTPLKMNGGIRLSP